MRKKLKPPFWPLELTVHKPRRLSLNPPSEAQLQHQIRFSEASKFFGLHLKSVVPNIIRKGRYLDYSSLLRKKLHACCVKGVYPDYVIDFEKLELTIGGHWTPCYLARWRARGLLSIEWERYFNNFPKDDSKEIHVFIYNSTTKKSLNSSFEVQENQLSVNVEVTVQNEHDNLHVWVFFRSQDKKRISKSEYFNLKGGWFEIESDERA